MFRIAKLALMLRVDILKNKNDKGFFQDLINHLGKKTRIDQHFHMTLRRPLIHLIIILPLKSVWNCVSIYLMNYFSPLNNSEGNVMKMDFLLDSCDIATSAWLTDFCHKVI